VQVDLLSHIAIRARNMGVLLATCSDPSVWDALVKEHDGEFATVESGPGSGDVSITAASAATAAAYGESSISAAGAADAAPLSLRKPASTSAWALAPSDFEEGFVGGKSLGIKRLAHLASGGSSFAVPAAFALPYGTFDRALAAAPAGVQAHYEAALGALDAVAGAAKGGDLDMGAIRGALGEVREAVAGIPLPEPLRAEISRVVGSQGGTIAAWTAISDDAQVRSSMVATTCSSSSSRPRLATFCLCIYYHGILSLCCL
jgi:alpha-glucan, water dikinase